MLVMAIKLENHISVDIYSIKEWKILAHDQSGKKGKKRGKKKSSLIVYLYYCLSPIRDEHSFST